MRKTFIELARAINKLMTNNKEAKTQAERTAVINQNEDLLMNISDNAASVDHATNNGSEPGNRYSKLINELSVWITQGKTDEPKDYKYKLKNENPSEIKDTESTNARIYTGANNYYKKGHLKPTDAELDPKSDQYNQHIAQLYDSLKDLEGKKHGNRFIVSRAIRETKDDLNEAISNYRGINEFNRSDNTITPDDSVSLPSLNNREYKKFLITTNLKEINRENVRLDKLVMDKESDDPIINDLGRGLTQAEVAKRNHVSQGTVSKKLKTIINTPVTE